MTSVAVKIARVLAEDISKLPLLPVDLRELTLELDTAAETSFRMAVPPADMPADELLEGARAILALRLPADHFLARQARHRRARLYFRHLVAFARHLMISWGKRTQLYRHLAQVVRAAAAGAAYLVWGRQPA